MIYLYIKIHNITGLKYLGKTVQDPHKYKGSGKRWINHLKKHGNDVTTLIVGKFDTLEDLRSTSIPMSEHFNIVDSTEWANLRPETGDGGDNSVHINYSILNRGKGKTYEERYGSEKAVHLRKMRSESLTANRKGKTYEEIYGKDKAAVLKASRSEVTTKSNTGRKVSESTKEKLRKHALGRVYSRCSCLICHKEVSSHNLINHLKIHP